MSFKQDEWRVEIIPWVHWQPLPDWSVSCQYHSLIRSDLLDIACHLVLPHHQPPNATQEKYIVTKGDVNIQMCLLIFSNINQSACSTFDWVLNRYQIIGNFQFLKRISTGCILQLQHGAGKNAQEKNVGMLSLSLSSMAFIIKLIIFVSVYGWDSTKMLSCDL